MSAKCDGAWVTMRSGGSPARSCSRNPLRAPVNGSTAPAAPIGSTPEPAMCPIGRIGVAEQQHRSLTSTMAGRCSRPATRRREITTARR